MYPSFFLENIKNDKGSSATMKKSSCKMKLFLGTIFMLIAWQGTSQEKFLKRFSFSEGLPTNTVYAVHQDRKGYIWFATNLGVCRYTGHEIEHYMPNDGVPDIEIFGFYEDQHDRLWMRTLDGSLGYYKEGKFYNNQGATLFSLNSSKKVITSIKEYRGALYISYARDRVLKIDANDNVKQDAKLPYQINNLPFHNGEFFLFDYQSIDVFDAETFVQKRKIPIPKKSNAFRTVVYKEKLIFVNEDRLNYLDIKENKTYLANSFPSKVIALHVIDSLLWVGTLDGAYLVDIKADFEMTIVTSLLKGKAVTSVCKDFEGGLWFSTLNHGTFYAYDENLKVVYNTNSSSIISKISVGPKKRNWIGFSDNTYRSGYFPILKESRLSGLDKNYVRQFCFIGDEVWGMGGRFLRKIEGKSTHLKNLSYYHQAVKDIILDDDGNYIIGSGRRLIKIPHKQMGQYMSANEIVNLNIYGVPDSLVVQRGRVNCLYKDTKGQVWVGANHGLFLLKGDSCIELRYQGESLNAISDFCAYNDRSFMVTTKKQGVFIVTNNHITENLSIKNGLNSPSCLKCEKGKDNRIFILTSNGLNQLVDSSNNKVISNLSFDLGVEKERIMDIAMLDDTLLIALPHRILSYYPKKSNLVTSPKLTINSIKVNGETYAKEHLNLSSKQRNIAVSFTGISFRNNQTISYKYQLIGASNEWISTSNRTIQFEALAPGSYLFKLKAINGIGIESEIIEIPFYIEIPLYKKDWFTVLAIILTIGGTWYLIKRRINRLEQRLLIKEQMILAVKRKGELEGELREIEQQALRLQMNPHFIFNALNTIKGYYSSKDIQKANTYISKFSKLLRIMLEHKERTISLSKEKELLDLYLKLVMLRYDTEFVFSFEVEEVINPDEVVIPSMLFQPFIENSIIHGISTMLKDGKIEIIIRREKDQLHCVIRDNGIGRKAAKKKTFGKSNRVNALDIIKRRLELIEKESGGETSIVINDLYENEKATGTEVLLTLPYKEQW